MTRYEHGFMMKCAECGVDPRFALHLLKMAQQTAGAPAANPQQAASVPAGTKPNAGSWAPPQGLSAKHQGYYDRWSKMDTRSQYAMLQRATPEQRQLLRTWSSPEQVRALTEYHRQQRLNQQYAAQDRAVAQGRRIRPDGRVSGSEIDQQLRNSSGGRYGLRDGEKNEIDRQRMAPYENEQLRRYGVQAQDPNLRAFRTQSGAVVTMPMEMYNRMHQGAGDYWADQARMGRI